MVFEDLEVEAGAVQVGLFGAFGYVEALRIISTKIRHPTVLRPLSLPPSALDLIPKIIHILLPLAPALHSLLPLLAAAH